jgi:hypothetical protein
VTTIPPTAPALIKTSTSRLVIKKSLSPYLSTVMIEILNTSAGLGQLTDNAKPSHANEKTIKQTKNTQETINYAEN